PARVCLHPLQCSHTQTLIHTHIHTHTHTERHTHTHTHTLSLQWALSVAPVRITDSHVSEAVPSIGHERTTDEVEGQRGDTRETGTATQVSLQFTQLDLRLLLNRAQGWPRLP